MASTCELYEAAPPFSNLVPLRPVLHRWQVHTTDPGFTTSPSRSERYCFLQTVILLVSRILFHSVTLLCLQAQVTVRKSEQTGRRLLPEEQLPGFHRPSDQKAERASYRSFEEAVADSEQLQARPPIEVTSSGLGSESYLTQPFQHLSWYPRWAQCSIEPRF